MSEDRRWREAPADAPSLEEIVGHDAVERARRRVREVMERYEEEGRRHADQDAGSPSSSE
jgi:hypothetical protein